MSNIITAMFRAAITIALVGMIWQLKTVSDQQRDLSKQMLLLAEMNHELSKQHGSISTQNLALSQQNLLIAKGVYR